MIAWLNPIALFTLAAVAAPIAVHLLLRHRATLVVVPTLRFVPRLTPQSVRLRRPSELWLLLVRVGIVASAAFALAGPLWLTDGRRAAWNERIARAVIVDAVDNSGASGLTDALLAETAGSDPHRQIEARELATALRQAVNWLREAPPARREIVLFSPFVHGTLSEADLAAVPREVGLRFVRTSRRPPPSPLRGRVSSADGARSFEARLEGETTTVLYDPAVSTTSGGLVIRARPGDAAAVERLRRVIARAGVTEPDPADPVVVRLRGGARPDDAARAQPETTAAALRLVQDPAIAGLPVTVTASGGELRVDADVDAGSLEAAVIVRAALDARVDPARVAGHEVVLIPDASLRVWSREPALPSAEHRPRSEQSDAWWFWLAALILLGFESLIRRRRELVTEEVAANAA